MKRIVKYLLVMLTAGFCFLIAPVRASVSLPARFSVDGYGSTDYLVGQADLMLPLKGNAGHNFYIDPVLAYGSDSQGYADLGVGYRWIKNSSAILGGYLFGGYSRIDNNARLWVVNPGVEALGSRWDAHFNGYLVMGDRNQNVSNFLTFDEFSGHSGLFNLFDVTQHAGDGVDMKLGYQLFPRTPLKAYVSSYFFSPTETNNVLGGGGGLEYWFDQNIKIFASYTYDNLRRSVGAVGLGVELGGTHIHRSDPSIEERITDPVERYLAELGRGSAIPSQKKTQLIGLVIPSNMDSIAFFSQAGMPNNGGVGLTQNNCTFENPCGPTDLTNQGTATLETLLPNTMIYFEGGTYSALNVVGGTSPVTIRIGQSINSYPGTPPSTFEGGFILEGNSSLNNIILKPTASTVTGSGVSASGGNVLINGSQIGSTATPFALGLALSGNTQANLNNSTVFASSFGVYALDSASLTTNASMINVNGGVISIGFVSISSGPVNFTNASSINVNTSGTDSIGYFNQGSGVVNFSGGSSINVNTAGQDMVTGFKNAIGASGDITFDASSINVEGADGAIGLISDGAGNVTIINNSSINVTGSNGSCGLDFTGGTVNLIDSSLVNIHGTGTLIGINAKNAPVIGSNINVIVATDNIDQATGLVTGGTGTITLNGIDIDVSGNLFSLISKAGGGPITLTGTNICMLNGGPVAC